MKKLTIYPFRRTLSAFVDYISSFQEYEIAYLVAPKKSGLCGHVHGHVDYADYGYIVSDDIDEAISNSETIALFPAEKNLPYNVCELVKKAISLEKEVVCVFKPTHEQRIELEKFAKDHAGSIRFCYETFPWDDGHFDERYMMFQGIYTPQAKVVFVAGLIQDIDQKRICLSFAQQIQMHGYHVSILGCNSFFPFLGFHDIETLFDDSVDTIRRLSSLIYKIDTVEKPDVILIEVPGEIMKFNNILCGDFGVSLFKVSQAVSADGMICCFPYGKYNDDFCNTINEYLQKKFDCTADCFHISNRMLLYNESIEYSEYLTFSRKMQDALINIDEMRKSFSYPIFSSFCPNQSKPVYDNIINRFENE